ncbi:MAG: secretin and TonB N-terminal domain-containing protein [Armatimonas sp.]
MDLQDAPLRATLERLLNSANKRFSIGPEVTGKVTMQLRDADLNEVLTELLRGTAFEWRLNNNVYLIGKRNSGVAAPGTGGVRPRNGSVPANAQSVIIPVHRLPVADLLRQLQSILPDGVDHVIAQPSTNALLAFSADPQVIDALQERVRLLDVQGEALTLKAEILQIDERGAKSVLFSTKVQTRSGTPSTISDRAIGAPPTGSSIRIMLTPTSMSGNVEVASLWEISLPLNASKGGPVRLEKSLTATAQLQPGKAVVVGETRRNQNGIKEQLQLLLTWEASRAEL